MKLIEEYQKDGVWFRTWEVQRWGNTMLDTYRLDNTEWVRVFPSKQAGFTLLEMLIVLVILGIFVSALAGLVSTANKTIARINKAVKAAQSVQVSCSNTCHTETEDERHSHHNHDSHGHCFR